MWQMIVPWWEVVLRGIVVYLFLLVFMRLTGKRQTGQYEPFDLILLLILSNAVQNSMNAGDNSLVGGLISASTLMLCHAALARLAFHFPRVGSWVDGKAQVLIIADARRRGSRAARRGLPERARGGTCHHRNQWTNYRGAAPPGRVTPPCRTP